jgi:hypothetical protein
MKRWKVGEMELYLPDDAEVRPKHAGLSELPVISVGHNGLLTQSVADRAAQKVHGLRVIRTQRKLQICTTAAVLKREDAITVIDSFVEELDQVVFPGRRRRTGAERPQLFNNVPVRVLRGRR